MASTRQLTEALSTATGIEVERIKLFARRLREADMLPDGIGGRAIHREPPVTEAHATALCLALLSQSDPAKAVSLARELAALPLTGADVSSGDAESREIRSAPFAVPESFPPLFGIAFMAMISLHRTAAAAALLGAPDIVVGRTGSYRYAGLVMRGLEPGSTNIQTKLFRFGASCAAPAVAAPLSVESKISGGLFRVLGDLLGPPNDGEAANVVPLSNVAALCAPATRAA